MMLPFLSPTKIVSAETSIDLAIEVMAMLLVLVRALLETLYSWIYLSAPAAKTISFAPWTRDATQ